MTIDPVRLVEAALFSSGKPLAVEELVEATKLPQEAVQAALKQLHADYGSRPTALEVVKSGTKWAMAVKTEFGESTKMLAAPEIPRKVLKTLVLIAFHQPIKQSDLKDMVGSVVYDHVHELTDRGMVTARHEGITKILQTTNRFLEYFGIAADDRQQLRAELARRVGLDPTKLDASPAAPPADPPGDDATAVAPATVASTTP